jgi:hypothetical protein
VERPASGATPESGRHIEPPTVTPARRDAAEPRPTPLPDRPRPPRPTPHAVAPAPPTEPLKLVAKPARSSAGTALLVAFVLLIVAAIVVAVLTVPRLFGGGSAPAVTTSAPTPTPAAAPAGWGAHPGVAGGSVARRMVVLARPVESGQPGGRTLSSDDTSPITKEVR